MTLKAKHEDFRRKLLKGGGKLLSEDTHHGPTSTPKETPKSSKVQSRALFFESPRKNFFPIRIVRVGCGSSHLFVDPSPPLLFEMDLYPGPDPDPAVQSAPA